MFSQSSRGPDFRGYLSMEYDNSGDPYKGTEELIAKSLQFLS